MRRRSCHHSRASNDRRILKNAIVVVALLPQCFMIENERGNKRKERRGSKIVISYRGGKNRNVGDV
jgi:hypothetical protein